MQNIDRQPACYNCIHGKFYKGYEATYWEPGEPDSVECQCKEVSDEIFEDGGDEDIYIEFASKCNYFQPQLIEICINCKISINQPEYNWPHWQHEYFSGESFPMCSEKCKHNYKDKQDSIMVVQKLTNEEYF